MATTPTPTSSPPPQPPQDHHNHPSPSPTTPTNPSSPKPIKPAPTPKKKTPPLPWTYPETTNLIQAYQDKWYSLKRGQLKASQWEEVSVAVAVLCGVHHDEPSKSATQCRHKIEKLRKRYRAEKQKPNRNYWPYFDLMDRMERGPLPISAMAMIQYQKPNSTDDDNDEDDDEEVEEDDIEYYDDPKKNKAKSINHIVRNHGNVNKSNFNVDRKFSNRVLQTPVLRKRKECLESDDDDEEEEDEDEDGGEREVVAGLAAEIRAFAERFVRMENRKMEMMRETQRFRMEMENKRMEMILESQRKIVDSIGRAFGSHKKLKMAQES